MPLIYLRALFIAAFVFVPCLSLLAQGGATATGVHSNEAFCKTMIRQFDLMGTYIKSPGLGTDKTRRAKYFADQKMLNATLVKTAPASLKRDVVLLARNANASYDAQLVGDRASMRAAVAPLRTPEHLAAAKRANDYCGVKLTVAR